jgi:hypothetical protein
MKKTILFGLLAGVIMLAVGMLISQMFHAVSPSLKAEYENPNLFRPWSDPLMMLYFVHPFMMGVILAWVWSKIKTVLNAELGLLSGINFGLAFWCCTSIPGMFITYASFPVSFLMVFSWLFSNLVQMLCAGILFSKTLK